MRPAPRRIEMIDDAMADIIRRKTPAERAAIAEHMWRFARDTMQASLEQRHPDWPLDRIEREVATRMSHGTV